LFGKIVELAVGTCERVEVRPELLCGRGDRLNDFLLGNFRVGFDGDVACDDGGGVSKGAGGPSRPYLIGDLDRPGEPRS
jgi:hypothetical protein